MDEVVTNLVKSATTAASIIESLKAGLASETARASALERKIAEKNLRITQLEALDNMVEEETIGRDARIELLEEEAAEKNHQIDQLETWNTVLVLRAAEKDARIRQLEIENEELIAQATGKSSEIEQLEAENAELILQATEKDSQIERLEFVSNLMEEDSIEKDARIDLLESRNEEKNARITELEFKVQDQEEDIDTYVEYIQAERINEEKRCRYMLCFEATNVKLRQEIEQLKKQINKMRGQSSEE